MHIQYGRSLQLMNMCFKHKVMKYITFVLLGHTEFLQVLSDTKQMWWEVRQNWRTLEQIKKSKIKYRNGSCFEHINTYKYTVKNRLQMYILEFGPRFTGFYSHPPSPPTPNLVLFLCTGLTYLNKSVWVRLKEEHKYGLNAKIYM